MGMAKLRPNEIVLFLCARQRLVDAGGREFADLRGDKEWTAFVNSVTKQMQEERPPVLYEHDWDTRIGRVERVIGPLTADQMREKGVPHGRVRAAEYLCAVVSLNETGMAMRGKGGIESVSPQLFRDVVTGTGQRRVFAVGELSVTNRPQLSDTMIDASELQGLAASRRSGYGNDRGWASHGASASFTWAFAQPERGKGMDRKDIENLIEALTAMLADLPDGESAAADEVLDELTAGATDEIAAAADDDEKDDDDKAAMAAMSRRLAAIERENKRLKAATVINTKFSSLTQEDRDRLTELAVTSPEAYKVAADFASRSAKAAAHVPAARTAKFGARDLAVDADENVTLMRRAKAIAAERKIKYVDALGIAAKEG